MHQHAPPQTQLKVTMFFWQFIWRTGSTASTSYQRKHCLTTAVKALSSLPLSLSFSLPHFCIFLFWCLVALSSVWSLIQNKRLSSGRRAPDTHTQYLVNWWKAIPWMLVIRLICVSVCSIVWQLCLDCFFFPLFFLRTHSLHSRVIINIKTLQDDTVCSCRIKLLFYPNAGNIT